MIARRLRSDEEYAVVIQGLVRQLQDAEDEVICLRRDRDRAIEKLAELTHELNRAIEQVIRMQAK